MAPVNVAVALLPVLLFLGSSSSSTASSSSRCARCWSRSLAGALAALAGAQANGWLLDATGLPTHAFSRYVAPLVEETLKAL